MRECTRTAELEAAADGASDELRAHARACPACADALLVQQALQDLARVGAPEGRPPAAAAIFRRARLLARLRDEEALRERALWPLRTAEAALGVALLGAGLLSGPGAAGLPLVAWGLLPFVLAGGALLAARR
jgi:hypothetical protein